MDTLADIDSLSPWGELPPVPRYGIIEERFPTGPGREAFKAISTAVNDISRAVQLGNHRRLVEQLDSTLEHLGPDSIIEMGAAALNDAEICAALSVYLTCLEQTYHWPGETELVTPTTFHDHKILVQAIHEPELRTMLDDFIINSKVFSPDVHTRPLSREHMTSAALAMAKSMFEEASIAKSEGKWPLPRPKQDKINLLNRTARGDIWDQGDYSSRGCHKEMGRLHEMVSNNGCQRRCQEIFEDSGGVWLLQRMPALLAQLDENKVTSSLAMCEALTDLHVAVARVHEELFSMVIDEVIWGHTFAKWSKACGVSDVGASGSDCPLFWMLDGFIGRSDPKGQAILPDSLAYRSRFFPPDVTALVTALASAPSLRDHVTREGVQYALVQAWNGLQQRLYDLYDSK